MDLGQITLFARWFGVALIVLTWIQVLPLMLGWIGFGLAAVSFIIESIYKKNLKSPGPDGGSDEGTDN